MKFIGSITVPRTNVRQSCDEIKISRVLSSLFNRQRLILSLTTCVILCFSSIETNGQTTPIRIAVLNFGSTATGARAADTIRKSVLKGSNNDCALVDSDLAQSAAAGAGYDGSLNLSTDDARDIGAAIGADVYFIGDAQTVRRSPSTGAAYFESFASVFLVSARTGRLILWERPLERRNNPEESEQALLQTLSSSDTRQRYQIAIRRTLKDEAVERAEAVESPPPIILGMSDNTIDSPRDTREPRPYRRIKPPYPESAAIAEVEAVVDVLVDVDSRGEVGRVQIARWAGYGLDQSVIDTVKQMHFFPALQNEKAVPMRVLLRYNFRKPPPQ
ncbi:MAG TPA: TonB family protein [Pyrinomonadaceae bacterium]|nr:TonB family protein [Pyrinomonadaceae bacterium]